MNASSRPDQLLGLLQRAGLAVEPADMGGLRVAGS
jgi:hypothetical protein